MKKSYIYMVVVAFLVIAVTGCGKKGSNNLDKKMDSYINDIINPLSILVISNLGQDKGSNYLSSLENKQLFAMEYILKDEKNNKDFTVLDVITNEVVKDFPTSQMTLAYYPYSLYKNVYKKIFNEDFDISKKVKSPNNNNYDNIDDYVYYDNKRPGANGLSIDKIVIDSNSYDDATKKYTLNVTLTYSAALADSIKSNTDKAEIICYENDDNIVLESFIIR